MIITQWGNNEVKNAIIKMQNINLIDDYERTLNCKWPNSEGLNMCLPVGSKTIKLDIQTSYKLD